MRRGVLWWLLLNKVFYNWLILLNVLFYSRFTVNFSHDLALARTAWNILCKRLFLIMITGARLTYWRDRSSLVVYVFTFAVCRDSGVWFYLSSKPYNHCRVFYTLTIICLLWFTNKIQNVLWVHVTIICYFHWQWKLMSTASTSQKDLEENIICPYSNNQNKTKQNRVQRLM